VTVFHAIWIPDLRLDRTQSPARRENPGLCQKHGRSPDYAKIITGQCSADGGNVLLRVTEVTV